MTSRAYDAQRRRQWRAVRARRKEIAARMRDYDTLERLQPPPEGYILGLKGEIIPAEVAHDQARMRMKMPILSDPYEDRGAPPSTPKETN